METEKIRVLLRALDLGSLSAAAEELGYTPSGVSRAVLSLEESWGLELLQRGRRGVEPSPSCETLLPALRQLVSQAGQLEERIAALKGLETGCVRLGSSYGGYSRALSQAIADFCREHPGIRVEARQDSSSALCRALSAGKLDLCLCSRRAGDFDWIPLTEDRLVAVLPEDHPLAEAEAYPVSRFTEDPFIEILPGTETDNSLLFDALGLRPNTRFLSQDDRTAMTMAEAGLGVTLVNELLLRDFGGRVRALPLEPPASVEIGIAVPSLVHCSPAAKSFLRFLRARLTLLQMEKD